MGICGKTNHGNCIKRLNTFEIEILALNNSVMMLEPLNLPDMALRGVLLVSKTKIIYEESFSGKR